MQLQDNERLFLFSWDSFGIESIVDLTTYAGWDELQLLNMLGDRPVQRNPANSIVQAILLRARYNGHRHYEVYMVICDQGMTENYWREQWTLYPQNTADVVRVRGHRLWSDRVVEERVLIK